MNEEVNMLIERVMKAKIGRVFATYYQRVTRDENLLKIELGESKMRFNKNFPASQRDRISTYGLIHSNSRKIFGADLTAPMTVPRQGVNIVFNS